MSFGNATTLLTSGFSNTSILNIEWLVPLVVLFICMLVITRQPIYWSYLALPLTIGLHILGLTPSVLQYVFATMAFAYQLYTQGGIANSLQLLKRRPLETPDITQVKTKIKRKYLHRQAEDYMKGKGPVDIKGLDSIISQMSGKKKRKKIVPFNKIIGTKDKPIEWLDIKDLQNK